RDVFRDLHRAAVEVAIPIQRGAPSRQDAHGRHAVVPGARRLVLGLPARPLDLVQVGDVGVDLLRTAAEAGVHEDDDALVDGRRAERIVRLARRQEERHGRQDHGTNNRSHWCLRAGTGVAGSGYALPVEGKRATPTISRGVLVRLRFLRALCARSWTAYSSHLR